MFQERNDGNYGETILSLFAPVCTEMSSGLCQKFALVF